MPLSPTGAPGRPTSASTRSNRSGRAQVRSPTTASRSFLYKTTIEVHGDEAFPYFECHDVGDFATGNFDDPAVKTIVNDTFLAGTLRNVGGSWLFSSMTAGPSSPLSFDHYYYP